MLFLDCNGEFSLARLRTGETAELVRLEQGCGMRRRLLDMGLTGGDPRAFLVRGAVLALRREDCLSIILRTAEEGETWA